MIEEGEWEPALDDDAAERALDKVAILEGAPPLIHLLSDAQILEEWEKVRRGEWKDAPDYWIDALREARDEVKGLSVLPKKP